MDMSKGFSWCVFLRIGDGFSRWERTSLIVYAFAAKFFFFSP